MAKKTVKAAGVSKYRSAETHKLECRDCGTSAVFSKTTLAYTCWECVCAMVDNIVPTTSYRPRGYPRGWKFMTTFVHSDGTVYCKGVEQPELKNTLEPTEIKVSPKDTRSKAQKANDKQDTLIQINALKKQIKKEKRVTFRRKLETQLKQIQKRL